MEHYATSKSVLSESSNDDNKMFLMYSSARYGNEYIIRLWHCYTMFIHKKPDAGSLLVVQWLGLSAFTVGPPGSNSGQVTKLP